METPTSFDLNENISKWRGSLAQSSTVRPEELDELELHLRDSMERLRARDLSEEEAFFVAARRLGTPDTLTREFARANPTRVWQARLFWILTGLFVFQFFQLPSVAFAMAASVSKLP